MDSRLKPAGMTEEDLRESRNDAVHVSGVSSGLPPSSAIRLPSVILGINAKGEGMFWGCFYSRIWPDP